MRMKLFFVIMHIFFICLLVVNAQDVLIENGSIEETESLSITKFFPSEVALGDVQFNIQVRNNGNQTLENVYAFVSGRGFSTYTVIPIESLGAREKDYIFVNGNVRESGTINLTIQISQHMFRQQITVVDTSTDINTTVEEINQKRLLELGAQLEALKKNYSELELTISEKKDSNYDLSGVDLEDLKRYLRDVESYIFIGNANQASVSLQLAREEYRYQKNKVDNSKVIPALTRLKENALIFSAIFGSILAFFALSELLKQKSERVYSTFSHLRGRSRKKSKK